MLGGAGSLVAAGNEAMPKGDENPGRAQVSLHQIILSASVSLMFLKVHKELLFTEPKFETTNIMSIKEKITLGVIFHPVIIIVTLLHILFMNLFYAFIYICVHECFKIKVILFCNLFLFSSLYLWISFCVSKHLLQWFECASKSHDEPYKD